MNAPKLTQIRFAVLVLLALSAPLDGGKFGGIVTQPDGSHVAVVLLPDRPNKRLAHGEAMAWAESVGGQLPSRLIYSLLFANLRSEIERTWHWTNETCEWDVSCAWYCLFTTGFQLNDFKSYEGGAVAVRLIHITD